MSIYKEHSQFEVSDFFKENNFQIVDTIADGQDFDTSFTPILDIKIGSVSLPYQVLIDNGVLSGILTGGRFMGASTGEVSATLIYQLI